MKRAAVALGLMVAASGPLRAQRSWAYEAGLFGEYTKFADTTHLQEWVRTGRPGRHLRDPANLPSSMRRRSSRPALGRSPGSRRGRTGSTPCWNWPLGDKTIAPLGGGFTGTNYNGDTTHNAYDSGGNVLIGVRRCMSQLWSWRLDGVVDFKKPSDQTTGNVATQTYSARLGIELVPRRQGEEQPVLRRAAAAAASAGPDARAGTARRHRRRRRHQPRHAPPPPPAPAPAQPRELFTLKGVLFEFDKSTLTKGAKDTLGVAVRYLKDHTDARVEIQGHTDSKGTDEYNMKLGMRRAESVKAYLGTQGIAADRITTKSFGESQPVAENEINGKDNPAGRALNRRVVIIELP